ncbi:MAG: phenylacetate-CoA oxygenase subunit PaaJ [Bacteroidota bacterium]|jgi:ring-1,2-phenylacetyl-CoA epoxidase subunit PaaD
METTKVIDKEKSIWNILETVCDPEIPVLSIIDLGIIRAVAFNEATNMVELTITPTYTGCPAIDMIGAQIRMALAEAGFHQVKIQQILSPAWTTDWMTESGKQKLLAYGIAPPVASNFNQVYLEDLEIACPNCGATNTKLVSEFGSTACKALFQCKDCLEPFDYFKCH